MTTAQQQQQQQQSYAYMAHEAWLDQLHQQYHNAVSTSPVGYNGFDAAADGLKNLDDASLRDVAELEEVLKATPPSHCQAHDGEDRTRMLLTRRLST